MGLPKGLEGPARRLVDSRSMEHRRWKALASPTGWALGLSAILALSLYFGVELYLLDGGLGFPLDDSFIHLVFARSLAAGEGLSYQHGELVAGSTAPLWTAILSLGFLLPGSPILWGKLLGGLAHLGSVATAYFLARELEIRGTLAAAAALLVAFTGWLLWSALAAMEVPLFVAVSLLGMTLHARERGRSSSSIPLSMGLFGIGVLLRPEGLLLVVLALADRLTRVERAGESLRVAVSRADGLAILRGAGSAFLVVAPIALFYRAVGESWLPTTFDTKMSYGEGLGWPSPGYLATVAGIFVQAHPVATVLAPVGAWVLLRRWGGPEDRGLLPALWLFGLPVAYSMLSGGQKVVGNFGRYYFPLLPLVVILAFVAVDELVRELPTRLRAGSRTIPWALAVGIVLLLPSVYGWVQGAGRYSQSVLNVEDSDVRMALWIREHLPREAVLAVNDIGAFGWYLENPIIDLAGIATPKVHEHARRALSRGDSVHAGILGFVRQSRPDYLAVFPRWFGPVLETGEFVPLLSIEVPDNITMSDDRVVLYATPWTRFPPVDPPTPTPETSR